MKLKELWEWVRSLAFALVLALVLGIFVFQPFKVDGHSMDPTLQDQQRIYVWKLSHTFSVMPDYGDIVVIDSRVDRKRSLQDDLVGHPLIQLFLGTEEQNFRFVKRVIGKPGDIVEVKDHQLYRNGVLLEEPYIKEKMIDKDRRWEVPPNHVFVMGDNRNNSLDSREIGFIPLDHVLGSKIEWNLNQ
ncbi:signal peptidase I [Brevibacillus composti]|uniref:Signal peptidase I n=1 Tax=Brevibacillus composti TaxID=2796470 RepID=A0A7T5EMY8_9BACL|nr:signal peptidase I [Brevibacillus composti]QQE75516.1 signal peptidase I [Brevibacillus composti]QUO42542.1 signal peptidase I [Brevibacillus composti]